MNLSEAIAFLPGTNCASALEYAAISLLAMIDAQNISVKRMKENIEEMFGKVLNNDGISFTEVKGKKDVYYVFDSGYKLHDTKERIFGYTLKNLKAESPKYFGIFFSRESLLRNEVIDDIHIADIFFSSFTKMNDFLNELANTAVAEDWNFKEYSSKVSQPILKNYIEQTYYHAFSQGNIYINSFEEKMCMNTGLLDSAFNDIYILCDVEKNKAPNCLFEERYKDPQVVLSSSRVFSKYVTSIPKPAVYYKNIGELYFDCDKANKPNGIDINDKHIFEDNIDRINATISEAGTQYKSVDTIKLTFESAIRYSLELAKRNYKLVAPQLWPETGKIQFLMPIYLEGRCEAQVGTKKEVILPNVALCLEEDGNGRYLGTSILTLDMAYQNARLIAKPDSFWLEPQRISVRSIERKQEEPVEQMDEETSFESNKEVQEKLGFAEFYYANDILARKDSSIIGLSGTIRGNEKAQLYISNLCDDKVEQEEIGRLKEICSKNQITVKILGRTEKGWDVSLKGVEPSFEQLIGRNSLVENELQDLEDATVDQVIQESSREIEACEDGTYIGKTVEIQNIEVTLRGNLRGKIVGSQYRVSISPAYFEKKGVKANRYRVEKLKVKITRWDKNAESFNAVLAEE